MIALNRFTNRELLNHFDSIKHHSPIILELCRRLEKEEESVHMLNNKVECPICQAKLLADIDSENDMFTLTIDQDT